MEARDDGSPVFAAASRGLPETGHLDSAASHVASAAPRWASLGLDERIALLDRLLEDCGEVAAEWLATSAEGKGVTGELDAVGQEWVSGPYVTLRYLRGLRRSLAHLRSYGTVKVPPVHTRSIDGRAVARPLPQDGYDRLFFTGLAAEVVMRPGIGAADVSKHVAQGYTGGNDGGGTVVVLGAGNVSGMGPVDSLFHLFQRDRTVVLKTNPVNAYMVPVLRRAFAGLIDEGFLRIVDGGPSEGVYLCDHPLIDEIHLTGSDKTYEAVVFGSDEEALARRERGEPLRSKPLTAELGGVGPAIVVPGRWTSRELVRAAELIATIAFDGGGYSCGAIDVILLPDGWPQLDDFIDAFRSALARMPLRPAFYPGADERYEAFVAGHENVELFGDAMGARPSWAFIRDLDPQDAGEVCFRREPFCAVVAETRLRAADTAGFLEAAVRFTNERIWGTLGVTLLVPSAATRDRSDAASVERAIADLRYGTVGVNYHPSAAWVSGTTPWGGYQAPDIDPAESGVGFTQNAMMIGQTEKAVMRAPLVGAAPAPVWLMGRGAPMCRTFAKLCAFEARPTVARVPAIVGAALGR